MSTTSSHQFIGIDAANPLGFLAALGTLRILHLGRPEWRPKLSWIARDVWCPQLDTAIDISRDDLLTTLDDSLRNSPGHDAMALGDSIKFSPSEFRNACRAALAKASVDQQQTLRFFAALGSEAKLTDDGLISDTALRTMSGAGHQHFLQFMRTLTAETNQTHLNKALFMPWQWDDPKPSLRWDPSDDRRYALRWRNPSNDNINTVRGANRLAIEALPLFPTAVHGNRLKTTGFTGSGSRDTFWTWPVWSGALDLDSVTSVLSLRGLQENPPNRSRLVAMGIEEIYRSQRLTVGKYRNFTIATPA